MESIVSKVIIQTNSVGLKDIDEVIGIVVKQTEGGADGKTISNIVKQKLLDWNFNQYITNNNFD